MNGNLSSELISPAEYNNKVVYFGDKVKKLSKLEQLQIDLSSNEIGDDNYVELIEKITSLNNLSDLNLSL